MIWSFYTASVAAITQRYAGYGVVRYDGSVSDVGAQGETRCVASKRTTRRWSSSPTRLRPVRG